MSHFLTLFQGHLTGYIDQSNRVVEVTHCFETPELEEDDSMDDNTMDYLKYIRDKGIELTEVYSRLFLTTVTDEDLLQLKLYY